MGLVLGLSQLKIAAKLLKEDKIVVFPTETVYGLGGNAFSRKACQEIFSVKQRPFDNPLIIHVKNIQSASRLVADFPLWAQVLARTFWPGPLTLLLPKDPTNTQLNSALGTSSSPYIALRCPAHPLALKLLELVPFPLAAPSANFSGQPSATSFEMSLPLLPYVGAVIQDEPCAQGIESTIVAVYEDKIHIMRPGILTANMLKKALRIKNIPLKIVYATHSHYFSSLESKRELSLKRKSSTHTPSVVPGAKYTHYQPKTPVTLFLDPDILLEHPSLDRTLVLTLRTIWNKSLAATLFEKHIVTAPSNESSLQIIIFKDLRNYTKQLYQLLFACDRLQKSSILAYYPSIGSIYLALRDRLTKASNATFILKNKKP